MKLDDSGLSGLRIHVGIDGRQWVGINNCVGSCAAGLRIHVGIDGILLFGYYNCVTVLPTLTQRM